MLSFVLNLFQNNFLHLVLCYSEGWMLPLLLHWKLKLPASLLPGVYSRRNISLREVVRSHRKSLKVVLFDPQTRPRPCLTKLLIKVTHLFQPMFSSCRMVSICWNSGVWWLLQRLQAEICISYIASFIKVDLCPLWDTPSGFSFRVLIWLIRRGDRK